jgi:type I restriction enzyme, S subunit
MYRANDGQVDDRWLRYYFQTPILSQQAEALSKGAAAISKLTLNPPQFWDLTIPLPPLPEQRRIVARIEELAAKINEVRTVRRKQEQEIRQMLLGSFHRVVRSAPPSFDA